MRQYGIIAVEAAKKIYELDTKEYEDIWISTCDDLYPGMNKGDKGCPKTTFIGLCERGYVKGVLGDVSYSVKKNKQYGWEACNLIKEDETIVNSKTLLWKQIMSILGEPITKKQNSQMDVVVSLYENGLLNI
ncbi:hypothetical protein RJG79_08665 [Mycoplasmatota bacterium WC44]